ncbi:MAG: hypothetical protein A2X08_05635 [Bacteroidetes bacterium GWA2_32_17]|nr:MAG: hypothetical protein A2X08_05635 [Bacteroidetes bacterium GWA2_32_17]
MGLLESSIVIYLREHYYPDGFAFPLKIVSRTVAITEFFRELATIIMLMAVGYLTGKNLNQRIACFIFSFAIWDIFYYVFLYIIIGWPSSFFTWDVLFLLPTMWTGPVIAPIITSLNMILLAFSILYFNKKNENIKLLKRDWLLLTFGSLMVIAGFIQEFVFYLHNYFSWAEIILKMFSNIVLIYSMKFVPQNFPWLTYCVGQGIIVFVIIKYIYRNLKR